MERSFKTELCTDFESGNCRKGDICSFAHGEANLRAKDAWRKPEKGPTAPEPKGDRRKPEKEPKAPEKLPTVAKPSSRVVTSKKAAPSAMKSDPHPNLPYRPMPVRVSSSSRMPTTAKATAATAKRTLEADEERGAGSSSPGAGPTAPVYDPLLESYEQQEGALMSALQNLQSAKKARTAALVAQLSMAEAAAPDGAYKVCIPYSFKEILGFLWRFIPDYWKKDEEKDPRKQSSYEEIKGKLQENLDECGSVILLHDDMERLLEESEINCSNESLINQSVINCTCETIKATNTCEINATYSCDEGIVNITCGTTVPTAISVGLQASVIALSLVICIIMAAVLLRKMGFRLVRVLDLLKVRKPERACEIMQCDAILSNVPQDADGIYLVREQLIPACTQCFYGQLYELADGEVEQVGIIAAQRSPCVVCNTLAAYTCPKCGQAICFNIFDVVNDGVCLQSHMVVCNGNLALRLPNTVIWITIITYKMVLHIIRIAKEKYPCAIEMGKQAFMIVLIYAVDGSLDILTLAGDYGLSPLATAATVITAVGLKAPTFVTTFVALCLTILVAALYYPSQRNSDFQTPRKRIQRDVRDWSPLGDIVEVPEDNKRMSFSGVFLIIAIILAAFHIQGCSIDEEESSPLLFLITIHTLVVALLSAYAGYKIAGCCKPKAKVEPKPKKDSGEKPADTKTSQIAETKLKTFLSLLTVDILQAMLKKVHAPVTGIKEDIILRIIQEVKAVRLKKE